MKFKAMKKTGPQIIRGMWVMAGIFFILNTVVVAQNFNPWVNSKESGKEIGLSGTYFLNSTVFTAGFTNTLYSGGFLEDKLINKASERLGKTNRLGGDASYGLYFLQQPVNNDSVKKTGYYIAYNWKGNLSAEFSEDLFNWIFKGNKNQLGRTSNLGESNFNLLTWRELQGGILWERKTQKTQVKVGLIASIIQGRSLFEAQINQLDIAMDTAGFSMDINSKVSAKSSAPNKDGIAGQGYGGSIGAYLVTDYEKGTFKFEMNDVGFISFNTNTRQLSNDTAFRWEGYTFNSFNGLSDSLTSFVNSENLKNRYRVKDEHKAASIFLPAFFKLAYEFKLNTKSGLEFGMVERLAYGWFPYLYLHYRAELGHSMTIGTRLSYGGYGGLNVGLYLDKKFGKHFAAGLGSNAIDGFILPNLANGQACMLNIRGLF